MHQADILCSRVWKRKILRERYICIEWDNLHSPIGLNPPIIDEKPKFSRFVGDGTCKPVLQP